MGDRMIELVDRIVAAEQRASQANGHAVRAEQEAIEARSLMVEAERKLARAETDLRWSKEHEERAKARVAELEEAHASLVLDQITPTGLLPAVVQHVEWSGCAGAQAVVTVLMEAGIAPPEEQDRVHLAVKIT